MSTTTYCPGHWAKGSLGQAYIEKNPLAALQAFAIASGWEQSSFMRRHFLGRALVSTIVHVHSCKKKMQKSMQQVKQILNSKLCIFDFHNCTCTFVLTSTCWRKQILQPTTSVRRQWLILQVTVPPEWIDAIFPGVRRLLETVQARNARMQSGKRQANDLISDKAAEGFLQTVLYSGICFWQNLPFRTQR